MTETIIYLLKVILIQGVFLLIYWLFFKKTTFHALNRAFLLLAIIGSFVIPLIELPIMGSGIPEVVQENPVLIWFSEPVLEKEFIAEPIHQASRWSIANFLPWAYFMVAVLLMIRSLVYLSALQRLKKRSEPINKRWFTLFKTSQSRPFSFFKNVFIPRSLFGSDAFDQVLTHECVHVRRWHSADRLLLDFVVSLFWFNPFIYCYRNALIEIHEYQADEGVLKQYNDPVMYQEMLFSQLQSPQYSGLVSHFNFQMIKKRIVMMNKQKKRTGWVYGLTVPVTLMMIFAFSSKEAMKPLNEVGNEITSLIGPIGEVRTITESLLQDANEPAILPLKESERIRMTSGYGMRMHPVEKVEKMHFGMDFACPLGTEVIATADGSVLEVRNQPDGYGKLMILDHGNGFKTYYAQLSEFKARKGDQVKKGQVIALSGNSGKSTAPHLHYEVLRGDKRVNPSMYIKNYKFTLKETKLPQVIEVKENEEAKAKSQQELIKKEQELARREQELRLREMELAMAKEQLSIEERERAREELSQQRELEKAQVEEMKKLEEVRMLEELRYKEQLEQENLSNIQLESSGEDPLYILDGEEIGKEELKVISPSSIESIHVLKDKSARDKYGKKGVNGVVEIKRKDPKVKEKQKVKNKNKNKNKNKGQAYRVIIDPGHGGQDAGVSHLDIEEKQIALEVAQLIEGYFTNHEGLEIILTRDDDVFMAPKQRTKLSEEADLVVSIHVNSDEDPEKRFTSLLIGAGNTTYAQSLELSEQISKELDLLERPSRIGVSDIYLLKQATCPSVHVSLGFLTNQADFAYMSSLEGKNQMALGIARAIESSLDSEG